MTAPANASYPALPPSPIDFGDLLASALRLFGQRIGIYALLALVQAVVTLVVTGIVAAVVLTQLDMPQGPEQLAGFMVQLALPLFLISAVSALTSLYVASIALGVAEGSAWGQARSWREAAGRTKGTLARFGWVQVLLSAVGILLTVGLMVLVFASLATVLTTSQPTQDQAGAILASIGVLLVLSLLAIPVGLVLITKFSLGVPAAALRGRSGFGAYAESWRLTKGHFWRILAVVLVAGLLMSLVSSVAQGIVQNGTTVDLSDPNALSGIDLVTFGIVQVVMQAISAFGSVFMQVVLFVVYADIDRRQRGEVRPIGAPMLVQPQQYAHPQPPYNFPPNSWQ
ncbi:glycerophosphoryl diester phosphodiesterase membrane domain-containing protein [Propionibacteriaceae bacterium G1746]|uniref:glycerophosphoryl diester phosphodiesterase membrane domain-containing protein n=1 Tax=Aestuariimicrobium sp. G57 TaxID=3418485 RepID=UPI003C1ECC46